MTPRLDENTILELHAELIQQFGGSLGVRDRGGLASALAQPYMTFDGQDLYATPAEKAVALAYSLILNHPFVDGNKRIGYAALVVFLKLYGFNIVGTDDEKEAVTLGVATGTIRRDEFVKWVQARLIPRDSGAATEEET